MAAGSDERTRNSETDGGDGRAVGATALAPRGHGPQGVRRTPPRRRFRSSGRIRRNFVASRVRRGGQDSRKIADIELNLVRIILLLNNKSFIFYLDINFATNS